MENQESQMRQGKFWSKSEAATVLKTLSIIINGQKAYGKDYSVADTFAYFELKLSVRFGADQVIAALDHYTDRNNDIPAPSDLIAILNPEVQKITDTEYIAAKEKWKQGGYSKFCDSMDVVKEYEKQTNEKRIGSKIENKSIASIVGGSVKRIN